MAALYKATTNNTLLNIAAGTGSYNKMMAPYIPDSNDVTITPSGACLAGYADGVLLLDGRVVLIPSYTTNIAIWNNGTVTYGPATTGYMGGCLLPNGNVLMVPNAAIGIGIYNPTSNTISVTGSYTGYTGCQLLHDGRVILIPRTAANILIYNNGTVTVGPATTGNTGAHLVNDYIYMKNSISRSFITRYNISTNTTTNFSLADSSNIPINGLCYSDNEGNIMIMSYVDNTPLLKLSDNQPNIIKTDIIVPYIQSRIYSLPNGKKLLGMTPSSNTYFGIISSTGFRYLTSIPYNSVVLVCMLSNGDMLLAPGGSSTATTCFRMSIRDMDKYDVSRYIDPIHNKGF